MTPERWEKLTEMFESVAEMPPDQRSAFLDDRCKDDEELRREIESLLAAETQIGDFIARPIIDEFDLPPPKHPESFRPGEVIGHYRIEAAIGFGGMGEVYRATDTKLNRQVALKILPLALVENQAFLRRFRHEAMAAATLNHPNVATIYSVEEFEGRPFITMELVEGQTLRDLITDDGIAFRSFLDWFIPVTDALAHAHQNGITHRDIKPGNIMISSSGVPKVLDFGLAQMDPGVMSDAPTLDITAPGQVIGTPSYMSPEQAEGRDVDHRTDIFSLGIVMYEALCGKRPFVGDNYGDVVREILTREPKPVSVSRQEVPHALALMVDKCLAKSPSARFSSMKEVCSILQAIASKRTEPASLDSFVRRFYSEAQTPSRKWVVATAALVLVLSVGGWYYFSAGPKGPPISMQQLAMRGLSQSNNVALATISPDGRSVAYVTYEEDDGRALWLRRVNDSNALRILPSQQVHFWDIVFSNDSESIYFVTAPRFGTHGTLFRISSLGGQPRKVSERVNHLGNLSPGSDRILFVRYGEPAPDTSVNVTDSQLISAKAEDGSDEQVLKTLVGESIVRKARYAPDGRSVFYIKRELDGTEYWSIVRLDPQYGTERLITRGPERIEALAPLTGENGLLVNAEDRDSNRRQLFHLTTAGVMTRVTNDLNNYIGVSIDRDGSNIVSVQRKNESRVWTGNAGDPRSMTPLTREPLGHQFVDWTPDGRVVFDAIENDRLSIWIADADGKNAAQLTPGDTDNSGPRVSGDGRFIVFTSKRSGHNQIWRMNIDGSSPVLLANAPGITQTPQFAADGKTVVFRWYNEGSAPLGQVSIDGGPVTGLDYLPNAFNYYWTMSPDGRTLAYTSGGGPNDPVKVMVRSIDSVAPRTVLDIRPTMFFKWMPDGKSIFYQESQQGEGLASKVFHIDPDRPEPKLLLTTEPDQILDLTFTRDGSRFAAVRLRVVTDAIMLSRR